MFRKLIRFLAKKQIDDAFIAGAIDRERRQYREKLETNLFSIRDDFGKKVIYCSNEWEDPIFAVIYGVAYITAAKVPMAKGLNVLTGEEVMLDPGSYHYADTKMVDAILKLNPFERWNIGMRYKYENMWSKAYPNGPITEPEVLRNKLKELGFI